MTVVVAVAQNGVVTMGADSSGVVSGTLDMRLRSLSDSKIVVYPHMLIGVTGTTRLLSLLKDRFTPPVAPGLTSHDVTRRYVSDVVEALYVFAKEHHELEGEREMNGSLLIGVAGTLWFIDSAFGITEPLFGVAAVGCGDQVVLGAAGSLLKEEWRTAESVVLDALEVAEQYSAGVRAPFSVKVLAA